MPKSQPLPAVVNKPAPRPATTAGRRAANTGQARSRTSTTQEAGPPMDATPAPGRLGQASDPARTGYRTMQGVVPPMDAGPAAGRQAFNPARPPHRTMQGVVPPMDAAPAPGRQASVPAAYRTAKGAVLPMDSTPAPGRKVSDPARYQAIRGVVLPMDATPAAGRQMSIPAGYRTTRGTTPSMDVHLHHPANVEAVPPTRRAATRRRDEDEYIDIRGFSHLVEDSMESELDYTMQRYADPAQDPARNIEQHLARDVHGQDIPAEAMYDQQRGGKQSELDATREALHLQQLETDRLRRELNEKSKLHLEIQNARRIHAHQGRESRAASSQPSASNSRQSSQLSAWSSVSAHDATPADNAEVLLSIITGDSVKDWKRFAQRYCLMDSFWLEKDYLRAVDLTALERLASSPAEKYANEATEKDAMDAEILLAVPEECRKYFGAQGLASMQNSFHYAASNMRSTYVYNVSSKAALVFRDWGMDATTYGDPELRNKNTTMRWLIGAGEEDIKIAAGAPYRKFLPIMFPKGRFRQLDYLFRAPWLTRVIRGALFGEKSLIDGHKVASTCAAKNTKFKITSGALAEAFCVGYYVNSRDDQFVTVGQKTGFRYLEEYKAWKQYFDLHWDSKHTRELVAWYTTMVFEDRDPDLDTAESLAEQQELDEDAALLEALDNSIYDFVYPGASSGHDNVAPGSKHSNASDIRQPHEEYEAAHEADVSMSGDGSRFSSPPQTSTPFHPAVIRRTAQVYESTHTQGQVIPLSVIEESESPSPPSRLRSFSSHSQGDHAAGLPRSLMLLMDTTISPARPRATALTSTSKAGADNGAQTRTDFPGGLRAITPPEYPQARHQQLSESSKSSQHAHDEEPWEDTVLIEGWDDIGDDAQEAMQQPAPLRRMKTQLLDREGAAYLPRQPAHDH